MTSKKIAAKIAKSVAAKIAFDAAQKAFEAAPNSLDAKWNRDRALAALIAARA
jgi:hypothetical protein